MSNKRILITILGAIVVTITHIHMLALLASDFVIVNNDIIFQTAGKEQQTIFYIVISLIAWKFILYRSDMFTAGIVGGAYFPFFMLLAMGWFSASVSVDSFASTLSMFTAFVIVFVASFAIVGLIGSSTIDSLRQPTEKVKNDNREAVVLGLALAASLIAAKLENQDRGNDVSQNTYSS